MTGGLESLLLKWKNIQIAGGFVKLIASHLSALRKSGRIVEYDSPLEVKQAFFNEMLPFGSVIRVSGRLSQYCPIYFPVAYSPQRQVGDPETGQWRTDYNPAPTAMVSRTPGGALLAFLFPRTNTETPRIVSPYHLDRTSQISVHSADASLPVLLDSYSDLERLVELEAIVAPLDATLSATIEASDEEVVRLYYHAFHRTDFYPDKGYVLDARRSSGASVRALREVSPFATSVSVELEYSTELAGDQVEAIVAAELTKQSPSGIGPARYQPAYYTPGGYRVVQLSHGQVLVHLAPELSVMHFSTVIDTTNPDRDAIERALLVRGAGVLAVAKRLDARFSAHGLFASDRSFYRKLGISAKPPSTTP